MKNKKILSIALIAIVFVFGVFFAGCSKIPGKFEISTKINGAIFGKVEDIDGIYDEGTTLTIKATPKEGNKFFCWLHDGKVESTSAEYTFVVSEKTSGTYLALFECADLEYISISNFEFTNGVTANDDIATSLTSLLISIGYNQNELYDVYMLGEDTLESQTITVPFENIYGDNPLPYAFDKTKDLYIKISLTYMRGEIEYLSETISILPKTDVGNPHSAFTISKFNKAINPLNQNLVLEDSKNCTITVNFEKLSEFNLPQEEVPEDGEDVIEE